MKTIRFIRSYLFFLSLVSIFLLPNLAAALPELKVESCLQRKPLGAPSRGKFQQPFSMGSGNMAPGMPMTTYQPEAAAPMERTTSSLASGGKKSKKGPWDLHQTGKKPDKKLQKAGEFYLSNDDSMSLASAQRIIYAIENFLPVYRNEIRPHELLNYFHFQTNPVGGDETFSVNLQLASQNTSDKKPDKNKTTSDQSLAIAVQGKEITKATRQPAVMTFILDRSGSMGAEGKMEFLKEGMKTLKGQLKDGDVLNVVEFDHEICTAIQGFVVGRDNWKSYDKTVEELTPSGSTDLHQGLTEGYKLANEFYDTSKLNRVILVTDAIANTGELSSKLMASITKYYDNKRIALSGIGVGLDFNDELLDTLTEAGKGAYLFLGIREAVPRVFGSEFISLLQTIARDVHFKLSLPENLKMATFYGEEASTDRDKVQAIHYFANSSQLFLLDLQGKLKDPQAAQFAFTIEYENALTGLKEQENFLRSLEQIQKNGEFNIHKARMIMSFADLLEKTALPGSRPLGDWGRKSKLLSFDKVEGKKRCSETLKAMEQQVKPSQDLEIDQVLELTKKYCARF